MKLKGSNIVVTIENTPIALCRDCSIDIEREMNEVASPSSGDAKTFIPGRYSWKMSSAHLVGNLSQKTLADYLLNKTLLNIGFETKSGTSDTDVITIEGAAYLKSFKMEAPLHGFATASCDFQGTGVLTNS